MNGPPIGYVERPQVDTPCTMGIPVQEMLRFEKEQLPKPQLRLISLERDGHGD